jgi:hypothetical protein
VAIDPPIHAALRSIDLPNIASGAPTTLAYEENAAYPWSMLTVIDGRHAAAIAFPATTRQEALSPRPTATTAR